MAEKKIKWTEQQRRAITQRGSDVLVTASAGTGKTAVLSGRCVDIASDKSICPDVLSILVLTFTNAAAEQMRSRISEQLKANISREKANRHLRHQLILLQGADIGTIHSFCKRLITEYFHKLGLDPTFRVIESDEQKLLKAEVLERCIEWAWEQSDLRQALEQLLRRRDLRTTDGFFAKITALSDFLDSVVSRQKWYERAMLLAEAVNPFTTEPGKKQKEIVAKKLRLILEQVRHAQKLYENENTGGNWYGKWEETFVKPVAKCIELLEAGDWDKCAEEIINYQAPSRPEYKPRGLEGPTAEVIRSNAESAKKAFEKLSELAVLNPDYLDKVGGAGGLQTKVLIELVRKFDQLYSQAKRAVNCLDFADLEHYALKLLTDENSEVDKPLPSETALALQRKYKYIFVDEYQDINPVQQAILDLLSSEDNIFVVGDVKQSIYAWRGAEPRIFLERLKPASLDPNNAPNGLRVDLNANWRSAKGILDFVNKIFARIMRPSFAKIDYDESAKLRPGPKGESKEEPISDTEPNVELHILDEQSKQASESDDEDRNVVSSRQRQAAMIAQRIRQMVGAETGKPEFQIYDKQLDKSRDVEYRDIVILMRSPAKRANDYVEVLQLAGVPVSCQSPAGYFEKTEISDFVSLLKVLDNPQRDIELAAVLRSPFFKISDTELAKIRVHSNSETTDYTDDTDSKIKDEQPKNFYDCVVGYCDAGPDAKLADKLKETLSVIEQWRTLARRGNLADLIWCVYRQTGYLSFVSALANGQQRKANLLKLHDRAMQFEGFASSAGIASLTRFVEFIEKLQEAGQDWSSAEPEAEVGNAVRIISVHKSKGLEFPVVFLAELDSQFNKRDIQEDCLANPGGALGLQIIDRESNTKLSSLAHQVIAEQKLSTSLEEEMRILYVATTRARERLVLTACEKRKNCRDIISKGFFSEDARKQTSGNDAGAFFGDGPIADWQLRRCRSHLEWILYGLCDAKSLHSAFETGLAAQALDDGLFSLRLYGQAELDRLSGYVDGLRKSKSSISKPKARPKLKRTETKLLSQIKKSLAWRYRFGGAPLLPAKRSATQLTHRGDEYVRIDYSRALDRKPKAVLSAVRQAHGPEQSRRADLAELADGRLIGMATHLVLAGLDLARPITCEAIEKIKEKLMAEGAIPEAVTEHINTKSIIAFFESELGQTVLDAENSVWREWPFTFALPASELSNSSDERQATSDESIIVQGIIDMLVKTPEGLLIIDFKTDNITAEGVSERAELYREQLELYSRAAGAILKSKILGKWLYFLKPGYAVEV